MRQRRALGETCCPRGVLNVDRLAVVDGSHPGTQRVDRYAPGAVAQPCPVVGADEHDVTQTFGAGAHLLDHAPVVRTLEGRRRDKRPNTGLVEHVSELMRAVGGIDVDENGADLRRGVLHDGPLRAVRRPDTDALTALHAEGHQTPRYHIDLGVEFGVGPPTVARDAVAQVDQRLAIRVGRDDALEVLPDGFLEDRWAPAPGVIRFHRSAHQVFVSILRRNRCAGNMCALFAAAQLHAADLPRDRLRKFVELNTPYPQLRRDTLAHILHDR